MALTPQQLALAQEFERTVARHDVNIAPAGQPPRVVQTVRLAPEQIAAMTKPDLERKLVWIDLNKRAREEKDPSMMLAQFAQIVSLIRRSTGLYVGQLENEGRDIPLEEQYRKFNDDGSQKLDGHYGIRRGEQ